MFNTLPTTAKFLSRSSAKMASVEEERRCFRFRGGRAPKEAWEGVEVEAAGGGLRRFGSTSTCAAGGRERQKGEEGRGKRGRTVLDPDYFVDESFVGELCTERGDHVDLTVDDDHRVDRAAGEGDGSRCGGGFLTETFESVDEALRKR